MAYSVFPPIITPLYDFFRLVSDSNFVNSKLNIYLAELTENHFLKKSYRGVITGEKTECAM